MALILPPSRPNQLVRANVNNPLARGLAAFYAYEHGGAFRDSVTGRAGTATSGQSAFNTTEGRVLQFNGSARAQYTNLANPNGVLPQNTTLIARVKLASKPSNRTAAAILVNTSGSVYGCPWVGFDLNGYATGGLYTSNGMVPVAGDTVDRTGQWITIGAQDALNVGGGSNQYTAIFINGRTLFIGSQNGNTAGTGPASSIYLGRDPSSYYQNFTGQIAWVAAFNRLLSPAEHLAIARNPYSLLKPAPDRRAYNISSGGETGSGTGKLPYPKASGSGTLNESGSGTGKLPYPKASGSGTFVPPGESGSGAGKLADPKASGTGHLDESGSGAGKLTDPKAAGSGNVAITGSGAGKLPSPKGGTVAATTGSGAGELPRPGAQGLGSIPWRVQGGLSVAWNDQGGATLTWTLEDGTLVTWTEQAGQQPN